MPRIENSHQTKNERRFQNIAVLMGGWSVEREASLRIGRAVAEELEKAGYKVTVIEIERDVSALIRALTPKPDAVFNALQGKGGEDGCIQGALEILQIPYTYSGVLASAIGMDKPIAKILLGAAGVRSPNGIVVTPEMLKSMTLPFAPPYVVKPLNEGLSFGVYIVEDWNNRDLTQEYAAGTRLLIETYIPGRELTVGVKGMIGEKASAMAVTEILTPEGFFSYKNKYNVADSVRVLPATIPDEVAECVKGFAVTAHETLGCSGMTRSDFRWDDTQPGTTGLYFLEINTQPYTTEFSILSRQAQYVGISFSQMVSWLVEGARCHA